MSATTTSLGAAALLVVGCVAIARSVRRPRPTLRSVRARLVPPTALSEVTSSSGDTRRTRPNPIGSLLRVRDRTAVSLSDTVVGRQVLDRVDRALRITGTTLPDLLGQIITFTAVGFVTVTLALGALISLGVVAPTPLWLPLVVVLVALFALQPISIVRNHAERRRRELRRVTNDFVQMVAVALTTNRSIEESVAYAAEIGDSDGFRLLQRTVASAQPMGVPVWEALGSMAETYELDELEGLASSMGRQAGVGVNIATTIRAEARTLRSKQLADLTDAADKANANLSLPTMGMVLGVVVFIGYPIVTQILEAFSA